MKILLAAMRAIIFTVVVSVASFASAQQGGVWTAGPYQKSRVSPGYLYYDYSAPIYPVSANPFGGYYRGWQRQELRRIRWAIEDANASRRWGR